MTEPKTAEPTSPFQKKYAGLPLWLYLVAAGVLVLLVIYYRRKSASNAATDTSSTSTDSAATVPPFINQVYVNPQPPEASAPSSTATQKTKTVKSGSAQYIRNLAKNWDISIETFEQLNPGLAQKYLNSGKKIPKGTSFRIPVKS